MKKQPFYKTGPLFYKSGAMSPLNENRITVEKKDGTANLKPATEAKASSPYSPKDGEAMAAQYGRNPDLTMLDSGGPETDKNNASLGRSRRQRKIANLKGKLTDVKAQTLDLASKSKKTGDYKEVAQKDAILGKHDQGSRIEKRIARKEGRQERKAIRQSLKGKETRGERRKQIIKSRQGQRKKVKSINNPRS